MVVGKIVSLLCPAVELCSTELAPVSRENKAIPFGRVTIEGVDAGAL